jgi:tetratricopeptide (TPR) repeat protein
VFTNAYTYRAITRSRLGNYDDALNDFHEAINLRPDLPSPYFSRGVTRLLNKQYKEAIEDFNMFVRHEKKVAEVYINRGVCYLGLKDTLRAYEEFETAIRTNREDPNGYNRRGVLYMQQNRFDDAEKDFNTAIKNDSDYLLSYFNRALVYSNTNRPMQALSDFDKVVKLDSTSSLAYFNRAIVRTQIGDYNKALEDYNRVAIYSPNVLLYYNRASLYARIGDLDKAIDDYTKAIGLYPDFANAYLNRSRLRMMIGDMKGAQSARRTSLCMTLTLSVLIAVFLYFTRYEIASLYNNDPAVVQMAGLLLLCEVLYQFPDGIQTNTLCALRGWNDTRAIFCISFLAYWVISLPVGWVLCMTDWLWHEPLGVLGFWIALNLGLSLAGLLYILRVRYLEALPLEAMKQKIAR